MNLHKNARLMPIRREEMSRDVISGRLTKSAAARAYGVCHKTASRWADRFTRFGPAGMADKSSRPDRLRRPTDPATVGRIITLRRLRLTGKHIARKTGVSPATVSRVLKRAGLARLRDLDPPEPVRRYEREAPGDLIHLDIKKLGRFERPGHRVTRDRTAQSTPRGRKQGGHGWGVCACLHRRPFQACLHRHLRQ